MAKTYRRVGVRETSLDFSIGRYTLRMDLWRARVSNVINGLTLIGLGSVFAAFYASGRLNQYLNPILRPLVLIAGMGTVTGGVVYLKTVHSGQRASMEIAVTGTLIVRRGVWHISV